MGAVVTDTQEKNRQRVADDRDMNSGGEPSGVVVFVSQHSVKGAARESGTGTKEMGRSACAADPCVVEKSGRKEHDDSLGRLELGPNCSIGRASPKSDRPRPSMVVKSTEHRAPARTATRWWNVGLIARWD